MTTTEFSTGLSAAQQEAVIQAANTIDPEPRRAACLAIAQSQHEAFVTAVQQREAMAVQMDTYRNRLVSANADLEAFRAQVREVAIRVAEEQSWCDEGLNDVLDELGLDRKITEYEVEVEVTARQTVRITVQATDEDDAREKIESGEADLSGELESYGWEWQTSDDLDFLSIEPA